MNRDPRAAPANNIAGPIDFNLVDDKVHGWLVQVTADAVYGAPHVIAWLRPECARQKLKRLSEICDQLEVRQA